MMETLLDQGDRWGCEVPWDHSEFSSAREHSGDSGMTISQGSLEGFEFQKNGLLIRSLRTLLVLVFYYSGETLMSYSECGILE